MKRPRHFKSFSLTVFMQVVIIIVSGSEESNEIIETPNSRPPSEIIGPILKSSNDPREYRAFILPNKMKAIVISDNSSSRQAAVSLSVAVGSLNDPPNMMGLTHFLEHILFLGSGKYQGESDFQKFIQDHGGHSNAVTQPDKTYYYFRIHPEYLRDALERLSHFFISPLFSEAAIEREIQAVRSEHENNISEDSKRIERVEAQNSKTGHPYALFRTGTLETLFTEPRKEGIEPRERMISFFNEYYSANLMNIAVLGSESLDVLQKMVEDIFIEVPNKNSTLVSWENPFGVDEVQDRLEIVSVVDTNTLQLVFPVTNTPNYYKTTSIGYVAHLLGQEGSGSLAAFLKREKLADHVNVGPQLVRGFTIFRVKILLTEKGLANVNDVVKHVFQYVEMAKQEGPKEFYWDEIKSINSMHFEFRDHLYSTELVTIFSMLMINFPIEKILYYGFVDPDAVFDSNSIEATLSQFTPQNCRVIVASKTFENKTDQIERFYQVKYNKQKIPEEVIEQWSSPSLQLNPEFHFPAPNEFISTEFGIRERDNDSLKDVDTARQLLDSDSNEVWYLQDTEYLLPKVVLHVEIFSPLANIDPLRVVFNRMWTVLISDTLSEFQYSGTLAGLFSDVQPTQSGLDITIKGYSDKLPTFVRRIFEKIGNVSLNMAHFESSKEITLRQLRNRKTMQSFLLGDEVLRLLLRDTWWSIDELIGVINEATLESLKNYISEFLSKIKCRWIFYGNLTPQEATTIAEESVSVLPTSSSPFSSQITPSRIVKLPQGTSHVYKFHHVYDPNSLVVTSFQMGLATSETTVLTQLLFAIGKPLSFHTLRTKEQLGYIVVMDMYSDKHQVTQFLRVIVQGNLHPDFIAARIDNFLHEFHTVLVNMTSEEFDRHRKSLKTKKLMKLKRMSDKMDRLHKEIVSKSYNFHRQQEEISIVNALTLENLVAFYDEKIINPSTRTKLVLHLAPPAIMGDRSSNATLSNNNDTEIHDYAEWKRRMPLFPCYIS